MKTQRNYSFILKQLLISSAILAGLSVGIGVTARADTSTDVSQSTTQTVTTSGDDSSGQAIDGETVTTNGQAEDQSTTTDDSAKTSTNTTVINSATSETPAVTATSHAVIVVSDQNQTQIDNKLRLSTDQTETLKDVTTSNGSYNQDNGIVTLTAPEATDSVTATYGNVGTYDGKAITATVTVNNIVIHSTDHVVPKAKVNGSYVSFDPNQVAIIFGKYFGGGVDTYNAVQDDVTITFHDEQGSPITINGNGYIAVGSLNGPSATTAGIEYINYEGSPSTAAYLTADSVVNPMTNPNTASGEVFSGTSNDFTDVLGEPTSENGAVTFQLHRRCIL